MRRRKWRKAANRIKWNQDGYLTIELSMVFSVLFFSLIFILFIGMVLYQHVNLQSIAVSASERGSIVYSSRVKKMTGKKNPEDFKVRDPYRNVPLIGNIGNAEYKQMIENYVNDRLGRWDIIQGKQEKNVKIDDYLISKRIRVRIDGGYSMPVDSISEMFGQKGPFQIQTTAVSAVTDAPDFVRNVDIAEDIFRNTKLFGTVESGYQKVSEAVEKLKEFLD